MSQKCRIAGGFSHVCGWAHPCNQYQRPGSRMQLVPQPALFPWRWLRLPQGEQVLSPQFCFCAFVLVDSCSTHSCALVLLTRRHICISEHHCGLARILLQRWHPVSVLSSLHVVYLRSLHCRLQWVCPINSVSHEESVHTYCSAQAQECGSAKGTDLLSCREFFQVASYSNRTNHILY